MFEYYTILTTSTIIDLELLVRKYMNEGWQPSGGATFFQTLYPVANCYMQTMVSK